MQELVYYQSLYMGNIRLHRSVKMSAKEQEDRIASHLQKRISRRQAMRAGGIAALGLAFSKPIIDTIRPQSAYASVSGGPTTKFKCVVNVMYKGSIMKTYDYASTSDNSGEFSRGDYTITTKCY